MTTPRETLNEFLSQFENLYGYSFYSAMPDSQTGRPSTTGGRSAGKYSKDTLYAQVEANLLKTITTNMAEENSSPSAIVRGLMSSVKGNLKFPTEGANKGKQVGSGKPRPQLNIDIKNNTGLDTEAKNISALVDTGLSNLAKRATQSDEISVQSEGLMTPQQLAIRNNPNGFFKADRVWKGETFRKGEAKPPAYLSAFGPTGNPQTGFKGPPTITNALDSTSTGFTDNGKAEEGISAEEAKRQLDTLYGVGGWTLEPSTPAPDGQGWMVITNNNTGNQVILDVFGGELMQIDPDTQRKAWDKAQAAIDATNAAKNATPDTVPIRSSDFNTDNKGKLFYWDPNTSQLMVQNEKGDFVVGQPDLTPAADGIQWITYTDKDGTWQQDANDPKNRTKVGASADTARFVDGRLIDTKQGEDGVNRPVWWDETANNDAGGWVDGYAPEGRQQLTIHTTAYGEDVLIDEEGNQQGSLGISRDYIKEQAAFGENQRQFNVAESGRDSRFYAGLGEDARQFDTSFGEDVRQFDTTFGEDVRQFDTSFGENVRQFDESMAADKYFNTLEELGRNYRTLVQTSPELANAATQQGELIRNILTQGGDVLARTFFTRGGQSPLPEITMADLINNVYDEANKIKMFERQSIEDENMRRMVGDMQQGKSAYDVYARDEMLKPPPQTRQDFFDETSFNTAMSNFDPNFAYTETAEQQAQRAQNDQVISQAPNTIAAIQSALSTGTIAAGGNATRAVTDAEVAPLQEEVRKQQAAVQEAIRSNAQINSYSYQPQAPTREQFTTTTFTDAERPIMDFQNWWGQNQGQFNQTPMLSVPDVPTPNYTTQEQLIAQSRATTPPAVQSLLSGQNPSPLQFGGMPLPTFQQLQSLTPDEQQMFNQRLMTEFNVPLSDVAFQSQRQFSAPSMDRNRDLAKFRGYSV